MVNVNNFLLLNLRFVTVFTLNFIYICLTNKTTVMEAKIEKALNNGVSADQLKRELIFLFKRHELTEEEFSTYNNFIDNKVN